MDFKKEILETIKRINSNNKEIAELKEKIVIINTLCSKIQK